MHTKSLVLAGALAWASTALAVEDSPRIYFPRHIKRQFINSTITRDASFPPVSTDPTETTTSKRQSLSESIERVGAPLLPGLFPPSTSSDPSSNVEDVTISTTLEVSPPTDTPTGGDSSDVGSTDFKSTDGGSSTEGGSSIDSSSSTGGIPPIIVLPTNLPDALDSLLPDLPGLGDDQSTSGILLAPTGVVTPTSSVEEEKPDESPVGNSTTTTTAEESATITDPPTLPTKTGILDPIIDPVESIISSIIDDLPPVLNITTVIPDLPTNTTDLPDLPTLLPDLTTTDLPDLPTLVPDLTTTEPVIDPPISTDPPVITDPPPPVSTTTESPPDPKTTTDLPPDPSTSNPPPESTTGGPGEKTDSTVIPDPTSTSYPDPGHSNTTTTDVPTPTPPPEPSQESTYTSVPGWSTVTGTEAWIGTKLAEDDSSPTKNLDVPAPTASQAVPNNLPNSIDSADNEIPQPDGTTLIRIAFDRRLHYEHVADNFTAAKQIFLKIPNVIADSEAVKVDEIKVLRLGYLDTRSTLGFLTTQVLMYVPSSIVSALQADILLPASLFYHNEDNVSRALAAAVNPSILIIPGGVNGLGGAAPSPNDGGGDPFSNPEQEKEQTPIEKGTTVGIAFGAVGVAAAYGAAMFLVARRYKRKKQAHRRASSLTGSSDMRYSATGNPAMMGGALLSRDFSSYGGVAAGGSGGTGGMSSGPGGRDSHGSGRSGMGNSGRTAYISAPVAAENSLGWN